MSVDRKISDLNPYPGDGKPQGGIYSCLQEKITQISKFRLVDYQDMELSLLNLYLQQATKPLMVRKPSTSLS